MSADEITPIESKRRPLRNHSYLTAIQILRDDIRKILRGRRLELNQMTDTVELGRVPITDTDIAVIRGDIELLFSGGNDAEGIPVSMVIRSGDVFDAARVVASENGYHPVREYLSGLRWDGVERISHVADDLLGAERSELNITLILRWMVSAVARAQRAGCKVDTMLILVGPQGALKSAWFEALAAPWYVCSDVDPGSKDSIQALRSAWICEWAELSALRRARDAETVKAFLSTATDCYRPPYGRFVIHAPRSSVIVGTSNGREFLTDETGNRRFWPITCGAIDLGATHSQRDQLWAEAVRLHATGAPWWLDQAESGALDARHADHCVSDAWSANVAKWAADRVTEFTIADVLEEAIDKPLGQWTRQDEMRVSRILRALGWRKAKRLHRGGWTWEQKPK